jgi:hypothetical protein
MVWRCGWASSIVIASMVFMLQCSGSATGEEWWWLIVDFFQKITAIALVRWPWESSPHAALLSLRRLSIASLSLRCALFVVPPSSFSGKLGGFQEYDYLPAGWINISHLGNSGFRCSRSSISRISRFASASEAIRACLRLMEEQ